MSTISTTSQPKTSAFLRKAIRGHPLVAYFAIAFTGTWALLLPFALSRNEYGLGLLPFALPDVAFFAAFLFAAPAGPALGSLIVTAITSGKAGLKQLLRRCVQWKVGVGWYLIATYGFLLIFLVGYSIFYAVNLPLALLVKWPLIFTIFFPQVVFIILTASFAEELGWRGFALARLQQRYGPVLGSLILGTLHGLWHLPVFFTRLLGPFSLPTYAGFLFTAIAATFLYTWIFNHTKGSVLIATLTHGCADATTSVLVLLIPAHLIISGWAQPFVYSSWQAVNVIIFGTSVILLLIFTRGRLGYNPERNAQIIEVARPAEASLTKVG